MASTDKDQVRLHAFRFQDLPEAERARVLSCRDRMRVLMASEHIKVTICYYAGDQVILGEVTYLSADQIEYLSYTVAVTATQIGDKVASIVYAGEEASCDDQELNDPAQQGE
jgi:hypothetical protein